MSPHTLYMRILCGYRGSSQKLLRNRNVCSIAILYMVSILENMTYFLFYDCLYLPHEDTCTHIDAIYPLATPAGVHVIVSSGKLIQFVSMELRESGVRRLPIPA